MISNGYPESRLSHLEKFKWKVTSHQADKPTMNKVVFKMDKEIPHNYTIYICQK